MSGAGIALTTASALIFLGLLVLDLMDVLQNPYAGIVVFVLVPLLFVVGLLLIPLGIRRERRRLIAEGAVEPGWPTLDLRDQNLRRSLGFVAVATLVNVLILSMASFGAVHYTESQAFCGQTCHEPMTPEFTAHQVGVHAKVECVSCHVGPGARGFIRGKLAGTRQLYLFMRGTFNRPIPAPVHNLPAITGTCLQCHWPERHVGDVVKTFYEHADDETNTATKTTVRLHVGGARGGTGNHGAGIHWHTNQANVIEYVTTDDKREVIPYVRQTLPDGSVREYFAEGVTAATIAGQPRRRMDCLDCHNRPAHVYGSTPERAVDEAIGEGLIDAKIPFVRREAVKAVSAEYPSHDVALPRIEQALREALKGASDEPALRRAIDVTQEIYRRRVFPEMKITWGTYPNQRGHMVSTGCFRCHDESHKTAAGVTISQDCAKCHTIE